MAVLVVVGASGFLGRYAVARFRSHGWYVLACDIRRPRHQILQEDVDEYFMAHPGSAEFGLWLESRKPDVLINCAGSSNVSASLTDPLQDFQANALLIVHLLEAIRAHLPSCRFLNLSSAAVYGNPVSVPIAEDQPVNPISPYGYHKFQAELFCREYHQIYGLGTASVRIFSAYGAGLRRQVIWDILQKASCGNTIQLQGTGSESRDFIHASDVAAGLECVVQCGDFKGNTFNLASGTGRDHPQPCRTTYCSNGL